MSDIIEYRSVGADDEVMQLLGQGWELYGSPCAIPSTMSEHPMGYFQAMVLKKGADTRPERDRLKSQNEELLQVAKEQHKAIDMLFALLISATAARDDVEQFLPTQSGKPWDAVCKAADLFKKLEGDFK